MKNPFTNWLAFLVLLVSVLTGCEISPVKKAEIKTPREIPLGTDAKPIEFRKIITKIPLGEQIGKTQYGWGCFPGSTIGWRGGRLNITDEELTETFRKELESRNYSLVGDPYALFGDPTEAKAEILVAGLVDKVEINVCFPYSGNAGLDVGNTSTLKGGAFMHVSWQIYSRREGRVVYETATEGSYQTEELISGGFPIIFRNAFAANVRNLMADAGFHRLVLRDETQESGSGRKRLSNGI